MLSPKQPRELGNFVVGLPDGFAEGSDCLGGHWAACVQLGVCIHGTGLVGLLLDLFQSLFLGLLLLGLLLSLLILLRLFLLLGSFATLCTALLLGLLALGSLTGRADCGREGERERESE